MNESLIVYKLSKFYNELEKILSGLKSKIILNFYGSKQDYVKDSYRTDQSGSFDADGINPEIKEYLESAGFKTEGKLREDFEVYILYNNAGSSEGHASGKPEILGGKRLKFTGRFEEIRQYQFIHILFPEEYSRLIKLCAIEEPGLNAKAELLNAFPVLSMGCSLYNEYLKSVYSSAGSSAKKPLSEILGLIETEESVKDFIKQKEKVDEILSKEARVCIYAVEDNKFKIYNSRSKRKRRCLNSWRFEDKEETVKKKEAVAQPERQYRNYEKISEKLSLTNRMKLLLEESKLLLSDKYPPEIIDVLYDLKKGIIPKVLEHLKTLSSNPEAIKASPPEQIGRIKLLLKKGVNYIKIANKYPSIISSFGGNPNDITSYAGAISILAKIFQI